VTGPQRHIPALDGLRALAILLVMARHGVRPFWSAEGLMPLGSWDAAIPLLNGWIGVDLFFGLSGFLIARHILDRMEGGGFQLGDYLKRRALRIATAYVAALLIAVLGVLPLYQVMPNQLGLRVGYHLLFLQDYLPADIVVAFWSLGVEEKFYLLAPLLVFAALKLSGCRRWAVLATLAAIPSLMRLATHLAEPEIAGYEAYFQIFRSPFHMTFDGMAAGMICAFIVRQVAIPRRLARILFWLGALVILGLLAATPLLETPGVLAKVPLPALLAAGTGAMILGLVSSGGPLIFRAPVLASIARLSYSLYLVHMMTIPLALVTAEQWVGAGLGGFLLFLPIYAGLSAGAAVLLHCLVERPFLPGRSTQRINLHFERKSISLNI